MTGKLEISDSMSQISYFHQTPINCLGGKRKSAKPAPGWIGFEFLGAGDAVGMLVSSRSRDFGGGWVRFTEGLAGHPE